MFPLTLPNDQNIARDSSKAHLSLRSLKRCNISASTKRFKIHHWEIHGNPIPKQKKNGTPYPRKTNMSLDNQWLEDVIPTEIIAF